MEFSCFFWLQIRSMRVRTRTHSSILLCIRGDLVGILGYTGRRGPPTFLRLHAASLLMSEPQTPYADMCGWEAV